MPSMQKAFGRSQHQHIHQPVIKHLQDNRAYIRIQIQLHQLLRMLG